jgi:hypothetical protein
VTRTGTKYHRDGCRYLSRSKIRCPCPRRARGSRRARCASRRLFGKRGRGYPQRFVAKVMSRIVFISNRRSGGSSAAQAGNRTLNPKASTHQFAMRDG